MNYLNKLLIDIGAGVAIKRIDRTRVDISKIGVAPRLVNKRANLSASGVGVALRLAKKGARVLKSALKGVKLLERMDLLKPLADLLKPLADLLELS